MGYSRKISGVLGEGHLIDGAMFASSGEALGVLPLAESRSIGLYGSGVKLYIPVGTLACCGAATRQ